MITKDPIQTLNEKIRAIQHDVTEMSKMTSSVAGKKFKMVKNGVKDQYDKTHSATKEYITEHPGKSTLFAGLAGFALGNLLSLLWRKK